MIEIREVLPAEFETVGELTLQSYVGGGFVAGGSPYAERLRDTATRVEQGRVLVAVLGEEVVGSLTIAEPGTPFADVAQKGELEFRMLAVSPQARGSGAGTALVRAVIAEAYDRGDHSVVISTQPEMVDARRIYDRNGFVPDPERAWEPIRGMELTVMVRGLA
ncbi:GNAT family N-acetyltransferase [Rhodococcus sp. ARC_M13]|uniref:GNAT family N-acetyltransferase n=1 Tax=Rhodococcus sp. ARC_M13 TaxID=2928855 RepID=UPI001FB27600|nr:GNAT family N-acetyltransferase [Rhodococcus sp. ARC_M13]MCJ0895880.1 GNAT family N-acetyltransferase [Rhodococcus sp. ARC_M13]